ncbi:MAG: hypothetical protein IPK82_34270 [Polyangiaceae bacterium]|nr:hypothetical protein [Polyangiaceae bacterium]
MATRARTLDDAIELLDLVPLEFIRTEKPLPQSDPSFYVAPPDDGDGDPQTQWPTVPRDPCFQPGTPLLQVHNSVHLFHCPEFLRICDLKGPPNVCSLDLKRSDDQIFKRFAVGKAWNCRAGLNPSPQAQKILMRPLFSISL